MAVGLRPFDSLAPIAGVRLASVAAGVKKRGGLDVTLLALDAGATVAGVFTRNAYCAAPVTLSREHLAASGNAPRALLINAGNANAGTGAEGMANARECCARVAERLEVAAEQVLPFSTGVISAQLPMDAMRRGIDLASEALETDNWALAARAIMTTDTLPKGVSRQVEIDGKTVNITGIAKGAGMICPNMATMLGFVATDASVPAADLQALLSEANELSFNSITIDGDTSTNDACVLVASGAGEAQLDRSSASWGQFAALVSEVLTELAQAIVRDGEGATKFIEVCVEGGSDVAECRQVGYTVAHSPLVKTAFFASDPNLGRILAAIGRAGLASLDISRVSLRIGAVSVVENGEPTPGYVEAEAAAEMAKEDIVVTIGLGRGEARWSIYTTDLSYDYVRINAEYRT
jgi:glutamate N-acetyltransferase/amino-acid N-acetyltransferase